MSKDTGTAVATVAAAQLPTVAPELLEQFQQFVGAGTETMTTADRAIPFIGLVQSLSPQRKKDNPKYIQGAEEGDIFNSVTKELWKGPDGLTVIPVAYDKVYNVWVPRSAGGGFIGSYADAGLTQVIMGGQKDDDDRPTQVTPTANHYVLIQSADGSWQQALLSMKSTQLTVSRKWNSVVSMVLIPGTQKNAPTFAKQYLIKSSPAKNDKGEYYVYTVEDAGWVSPEVFPLAVAFRTSLQAGKVKVDYTKDDEASATSVDDAKDKGDLNF